MEVNFIHRHAVNRALRLRDHLIDSKHIRRCIRIQLHIRNNMLHAVQSAVVMVMLMVI